MILILQKIVPFYRIPLFEELSKEISIHIITTEKPTQKLNLSNNSKLTIVRSFSISKFIFFNPIPYFFSNKYKSIILESNPFFSFLYLVLLPFRGHKIVLWGSWKTENKVANIFRKLTHLISKGAIFYSDSHIKYFARCTFNKKNLRVSRNTLLVSDVNNLDLKNNFHQKKYIMFVGKLVYRKRLFELLKIWKEINIESSLNKKVKLLIIGKGDLEDKLKKSINENNLNDLVIMKGEIIDSEKLKEYYLQSFGSISLGQVGLFAPQSMLHGVPFLCLKGSHSGGEIDNVINGKTGYLCNQLNELKNKIIEIINIEDYSLYISTLAYAKENLNKRQMIEPFIYFDK